MIKPTIGRVVWFHPESNGASVGFAPSAMCAAIVAHVHSDRCVNLAVFDASGVCHSRCSVPLLQDGDAAPAHSFYAEWMPFQIGQAKKQEAEQPKAPDLTEYDRTEALKLAQGCIYRGLYKSFDEYVAELERFTLYLKTGETGVKS